jgi:hypothetical protein
MPFHLPRPTFTAGSDPDAFRAFPCSWLQSGMATRRTSIGFFVAGGLFALAAIRDIWFPHFFTTRPGNPVAELALGFFFIVFGAAQLRRAH